MLNILAAGELHYWNVLRQHIQDNDRGDKISHTVWLYNCHGSSKHAVSTLACHWPRTDVLFLQLASARSQWGDSLSISDYFHLVFKCLQL